MQEEPLSPSVFGSPISTAPDFASVLVPGRSWFHFKTIKIMSAIIFHFGERLSLYRHSLASSFLIHHIESGRYTV